MFSFIFPFVLLVSASVIYCEDLQPVIQTNNGGISGLYKESYNGRKYAVYEGIPYALPTVLERRFQPPEPIGKWVGNLTATKPSSACIQYSHTPFNLNDRVEGSEDCLYLNVYVPNHNENYFLPIIFYIHGGAFQFGSADTGTKYLMDRDIIVVTVNYRLGIFGFLSTEDDIVPGNMGLKDQSLALRWVSENIQYFGGDPKKITLLGNSAGAASVHYHYLSPLSKGLFQNGISLSGGVFGPGKQTEHSREKAEKLGHLLGCPTRNTAEMIECLRYRHARSIAQATSHFMPFLYNPFTPFGPVVENYCKKPFIDRSPAEIIKNGDIADVPWITSIVGEEGLYPAAEFIEKKEIMKELDKNWNEIAPHLLDYNFTIPLCKHDEVSQMIKKHYLGSMPINKITIDPLVALIGDRLYVVDGEKVAKFQARANKSPVYFFYYNYRALGSYSDYFIPSKRDYGVCHSDDVSMIFENNEIIPPKRPEDRAMQEKLLDLLVSFAENKPDLGLNFEWKPVDSMTDDLDYLHIAGPNDIRMDSDDNFGQKSFWSTINFDENKF